MAYPRKSAWWNAHFACFLIITLFGGFLLIFVAMAGQALIQAVALERRGVEVEGTITGLWTVDSQEPYRGSYVFTVDGQEFTGEGRADQEIWERAEVGGKILVRYVQDDPAISGSQLRRDLVEAGGERYSDVVLGALVAITGFFFLRDVYKSFEPERQKFWLRDHGVVRSATVLATEPDDGAWSFTWRDEAGVDGRAGGISQAMCPKVGATITVFAHPVEAWPTAWEGEVGSRMT